MYREQTSIFETHKRRGVTLMLAMIATLGLTACGGGGTTGSPMAGRVVDGYIKGAKVCIDMDDSGTCDAGEPSAVTGEGGTYTLFAQEGVSLTGKYLLAEVTATSVDSDNPGQPAKPAKLLAFADQPEMITPLTTVVAGFVKADTTLTKAQAEANARSLLGLPEDLNFQDDFIARSDSAAHAAARVIYQALANVVGTGGIDDVKLKLVVANAADLAKQAYADPTQVTALLATVDSQTKEVSPVYKTVATVDMKKFNGFDVMRSRFVPQYSGNVAAAYSLFSGEFGADIRVTNFADYTAQVNKDGGGPVKFKIDLYASQKNYGDFTGLAEFDLVWLTTDGYWHIEKKTIEVPADGKDRWRTYEIDTGTGTQAISGGTWGVLADDNLLQVKTGKDGWLGPNIEVMIGKIQMSNDDWTTSTTITPDNNWDYYGLEDTYPEFFVVPAALASKGDLVKMIKTAGIATDYSGMLQENFASGLSGSSVTMEVDVYQESSSFPFNVVAQKAGDYTVATSVANLNATSEDPKGKWKTYRFTLTKFDAAVHTDLVILPDPGVTASDQTMYVSNMKVVDVYDPFK